MNFLNSLLLTLIKALHTFINNYALTIIVFTILIKLVVMPLNLKSRRSHHAHVDHPAQGGRPSGQIQG